MSLQTAHLVRAGVQNPKDIHILMQSIQEKQQILKFRLDYSFIDL